MADGLYTQEFLRTAACVLNMEKLRWVDISKGIVICLMVLGHSSIPEWFSRWIWSFHMPFFFIISAMFTSWDKQNIVGFIKHKAKALLIPFVIYSVINMAIYPFALDVPHSRYIDNILINGWGGVALWFVPVFFISLVITKIIKSRYLLLFALLLTIIGSMLCHYKIQLPWTLSSVPFAAALMMAVRKYRYIIRRIFVDMRYPLMIVVLLFTIAISLIISHYWRLDMASNTINPIIPISMGIGSGTISVIIISILLSKLGTVVSVIFENIGRNTYEIMALSQVIIASINHFTPMPAVLKYLGLIIVLIGAVYLRRVIEHKYANSPI